MVLVSSSCRNNSADIDTTPVAIFNSFFFMHRQGQAILEFYHFYRASCDLDKSSIKALANS